MESDNSLLPIDILEVESKPDEYEKRFIIPSVPRGYHIKTDMGLKFITAFRQRISHITRF